MIVKDQSLERRQVTEDHPSKLSHGKKTPHHRHEVNDSSQRRKNHVGHGIDGHTETLRSLRGHNAQLLLGDHNPADVTIGGQRLNRLFGFSLQGGKKEPIVQIAEKAYLRSVCPRRHNCEEPGEGLESGRQTKKKH